MTKSEQPALQRQGGVHYSGKEELYATALLRNYNAHICSLFATHLAHSNKDKAILDFGAGYGILADRMSEYGTIKCLEIDPELAAYLSTKHPVAKSLSDIENDSMDLIYSSNVLEHIEDDLTTLQELLGKLKKNGRLCLYLPAFKLIWSRMDERVGHHRRYSAPDIQNKLVAAGFRVMQWHYVDSLGFFASLLFKLIGSKDGEVSSRALKLYDRYCFPLSLLVDRLLGKWVGKNIFIAAMRESD